MGRTISELADAFFRLGAGTYTEPTDAVDGSVTSVHDSGHELTRRAMRAGVSMP